MPPAPQTSHNALRGIAFMLAGTFFMSLNNAVLKWLSAGYPLYEIVFFRASTAICLLLAIMHFEGGLKLIRTQSLPLLIVRGLLMVLTNMFFFMGVVAMPISEALALLFTAPLLIT